MTQIYTPKQDYKVLCLCKTFNHSKYIEDTLNGFAMQMTDFPFVCLVIDDCSTDGEQEVIKAWLERECDMTKAECIDTELATIVLVPNRINPTCSFAVYFLKKNLFKERVLKDSLINPWREHCEYEALCEGDDYWIDKEKIQKQINFLEKNHDYSMCCTNGSVLSSNTIQSWNMQKTDCDISVGRMILGDGGNIFTASIVYRLDIMTEYPNFLKDCAVGDYPLQIWCAYKGNVRYFSTSSIVYRFMHEGSWSTSNLRPSYEKAITLYDSILRMLAGFDDYTNRKYHLYVGRIQTKYLLDMYKRFPDKIKHIKEQFQYVFERTSFFHKLLFILLHSKIYSSFKELFK